MPHTEGYSSGLRGLTANELGEKSRRGSNPLPSARSECYNISGEVPERLNGEV